MCWEINGLAVGVYRAFTLHDSRAGESFRKVGPLCECFWMIWAQAVSPEGEAGAEVGSREVAVGLAGRGVAAEAGACGADGPGDGEGGEVQGPRHAVEPGGGAATAPVGGDPGGNLDPAAVGAGWQGGSSRSVW